MLEGVAVQGDDEGGEGAHVAGGVAQQIVDGLGGKFQRPLPGLGGEGSGFFGVGEGLQAVDETGAQAGAQVLPQGQMGGGLRGCGEEPPARGLLAIEGVEEGDLATGVQGLHVIHGQPVGSGQGGQGGVGGGVEVGEAARLEEMAATGPGFAPQAKGELAALAGQPAGESIQGLAVASGDEVVQAGRAFRQEFEKELAHGGRDRAAANIITRRSA